jgi:hypothetical protein
MNSVVMLSIRWFTWKETSFSKSAGLTEVVDGLLAGKEEVGVAFK